ncbi:methyl-accepting chemotaxis protein [Desulfobaculum xiamenense]|uniref:Methyl-accepting chemotaxis protein n=1 Tax=Desulfobaculum xiamenense TaxID=995050 RepID=A0A846QRK3_9BACT|nr:methyl-accepting chemotaxis protein [Desulfobaculum xiamenense]NJB69142.1 methyl-accepting chemotaxis protein [Desulfobaculum xiamenense]
MRLTIKTRILLSFISAIILATVCITGVVAWKMHTDAEQSYWDKAKVQLDMVDRYLTLYFEINQHNAAYLAKMPELATTEPLFPNFKDTTSSSAYDPATFGETAQEIIRTWRRMQDNNPFYCEIFTGHPDGSFGTSLTVDVPARFTTAQRPWYKDAMAARTETLIGNAYKANSGASVTTVLSKIRTPSGELAGVLGIDTNLDTLEELIRSLNFGKTGHFVLIEASGRVLCDPKDSAANFKMVNELREPAWRTIFASDEPTMVIDMNGQEMLVSSIKSATGFRVFSLASADEVHAVMRHTLWTIAMLAAGIIVAVSLFALWLTSTISRPLGMLVSGADRLAQGDFNGIPDGTHFYGEILALRDSLAVMAQQLGDLFKQSAIKTREAEEETAKAMKAMQEAEEAKHAAERARREGMLTAADQLADIVAIVASASEELSAQIEQSSRGANEQVGRVSETTKSMREMNETVLSIARNAGTTAEVSTDTKQKALDGETATKRCIDGIGEVRDVTERLKGGISELANQAQAIDEIMGVISDIADQTNLLALNAAIEAARAGDAGRGFAVVADEVRKLAEKTMASTSDVEKVIRAIQHSSSASVRQMDEAAEKVGNVTAMAAQCGEALREIVSMADTTADQVQSIAAASEEQSAASEEISNSITQVNTIADETSQAMGEASRAVAQLAEQAQKMATMIEGMKQA